jgi:hypothetical protein
MEAAGRARKRSNVAELELHLDAMRAPAAYCATALGGRRDRLGGGTSPRRWTWRPRRACSTARAQAQHPVADHAGAGGVALRALVAEIWSCSSPSCGEGFDSGIR